MRIYLDNCCYNRPYDTQAQPKIRAETNSKIFVQILIKRGELELFTSFVLIDEVNADKDEEKKTSILDFVTANSSGYVAKDKIELIRPIVHDIMKTGVKDKDATHVACAILAGCDYFITCDGRLLKYQSDKITLVDPIQFSSIWEDQ